MDLVLLNRWQKERHKHIKRIVDYYKESDSRAPDSTKALFGDIKLSSVQAVTVDNDQVAADTTAMAKEDLEMALGKEIKCEEDLVYEDFIKEATFYKSLANGTDIAAEELNEDVPEKLPISFA
ncbi:hypothetical protein HMPREF1544_02476 [Mucor circinelloides 1006PhL]|uniref:Uncharacterized protein n=1 Tax=Mucor circinelloides f. circinelloides (strain 1006PhL) TaxID=1220926 RepID=S2JK59_MUCC1|nr:hypothetical protein HMPREF1544_02476 [Mucor circinelloides 1006PhL]